MSTATHIDILGISDSNDFLFILFIPSRDKNGVELADHHLWVEAAAKLMGRLFGGSTIMPPARGAWLNPETDQLIMEDVVLIHSYTSSAQAVEPEILEQVGRFVHRLGRETNQGEIGIVLNNVFHRIRNFTFT